jgi:hypothetical protein
VAVEANNNPAMGFLDWIIGSELGSLLYGWGRRRRERREHREMEARRLARRQRRFEKKHRGQT